MLVEHYRL
jgi:hypothetical protein